MVKNEQQTTYTGTAKNVRKTRVQLCKTRTLKLRPIGIVLLLPARRPYRLNAQALRSAAPLLRRQGAGNPPAAASPRLCEALSSSLTPSKATRCLPSKPTAGTS